MRINKNLIISASFFSVFLGVVAVSELDLIDEVTKVEIVLAKGSITSDERLTEKNVYMGKIPRELVTKDMIRNLDDVIGSITTTDLGENEYVTKKKLDSTILKPTPAHLTFPIPSEWVYQVQGSLRRYDLVNVVAVKTQKNTDSNSKGIASVKNDFTFQKVPVIFVKDGKNTEVQGQNGKTDRLNGISTPSALELSLTLEQFKQMEKLFIEGYKFIFAY